VVWNLAKDKKGGGAILTVLVRVPVDVENQAERLKDDVRS